MSLMEPDYEFRDMHRRLTEKLIANTLENSNAEEAMRKLAGMVVTHTLFIQERRLIGEYNEWANEKKTDLQSFFDN